MKYRLLGALVLGSAARLYAGGVIELIPEQPGPYVIGQSVSVDVWLHNEETFDIGLRLVALDIQGLRDRLFAGGDFVQSGGVMVNHVAKLSDGSWMALDLGIDGPVHALQACPLNGGTTLYAGGESPNPNQLYDWDATVHRMELGGSWWSEIGRGESDRTLSFLCASEGSNQWMYAGGNLWDFAGTESRHIAKWNGSEWSAMPGLNGDIRDMLTFDDGSGPTLYVAGEFPNPMPPYSNVSLQRIAKWTGTAWAPLYTGLMFGNTEWAVNALGVFDDGQGPALYAGGDFWYSYISETDSLLPVFNIARWDGVHWSSLGGLTHSDHRQFVRDMVVFEDSCGPAIFVAGRFENAGGVPDAICSDMTHVACNQLLYPYFDDGIPVNNIARWDGSSWSDVGGGVTGDADAAIYALAVLDDGSGPALFAAGRFTGAGGVAASNIAKWDGTSWSPVGAGLDDTVRALAVHKTIGEPNLVIGEFFQFDFASLTDGGAQYAVFADAPPLLIYLGDAPVAGSILQVPASGSIRLGVMQVTMPETAGTFLLDAASAYGPYGGSLLAFGFEGSAVPYTEWFAENGDLTCDTLSFAVLEGLPPVNDACENALPASAFELTVPAAGQELTVAIDNTWATGNALDPPFTCRYGCVGRGAGSLWYRLALAGSNSLAVWAIGSGTDPLIALYESPSGTCTTLNEIACSDNNCVLDSYLEVSGLSPSSVYYLQVACSSPELQGMINLLVRREPFSLLQADPSGVDRNRSLSFEALGPTVATAIQVTLIDLQNPNPPNLPQYPSPDFSGYEIGTCGDPGGCIRWVGKPGVFLEAQDDPSAGNFKAARLQCTPVYHNFATEGLIHVVGAEIAPSSTYEVTIFPQEADVCGDFEVFQTARWGDISAPFNPPSTSTQPNAIDVVQSVNSFKHLVGAPVKAIAQLQPNLVELNADLNALDIVAVVDAVKQFAYSFGGPCPCPSTVICGATFCATPSVCVSTYGTGALCVKTCTGGANVGDPCINDSHCPGSACGAGFCRDRCGRCSQ